MKALKTLFLVAALAAAYPPAARAGEPAETAGVWARHVEKAITGDVDAVMADFDEDSVIVTAGGSLEGRAAIRGFFEDFLAGLTPDAVDSIVVTREAVHGKVVVFDFTVGAAGRSFRDTALIEDGRIKVLATLDYPAE